VDLRPDKFSGFYWFNDQRRFPHSHPTSSWRFIHGLFWLIFCLAACTTGRSTSIPSETATLDPATPNQPTTDVLEPTPAIQEPATTTPSPSAPTDSPAIRVYFAPYLPQALQSAFGSPAGYITTTNSSEADIRLEYWLSDETAEQSVTWWTYVLVAPFPTILQGVSSDDLHLAWRGQSTGPFAGLPLLMDAETLNVFTAWWGVPADGAIQIHPTDGLLDAAWEQRTAWAIVPFEALEPRWKVLSVDDISPLQRDFDPHNYPLSVPFALTASPGSVDLSPPAGNRDQNRLTILDLTGVTAMVRGTALWMERYGITYPAQDIGALLSSADITHISNEIPFTPECPYPELHPTGMVFCSSPLYIDLVEAVGADIIELTGDHFGDWGPEALYYSLSLYQDHNLQTYGGGVNQDQARQPLLIEHNGNRLAFLGCNIGCQVKPQVPCTALATVEQPGAAVCDFDWIQTEISSLTNQGYQVIFTFQHREEYTTTATSILVQDFGNVAQMGAAIVSGSQAHQPHGFAFENGAFIHYGLGNLFFDQYHFCAYFACDYAFIDRHIFYAGQHISTELIPIRFVDLARPRLMTSEEAANFLELIFAASGW